MKKICFVLVLSALLSSYGCIEQNKDDLQSLKISDVNNAKSEFPNFLVGVWIAEAKPDLQSDNIIKWGLKFEPSGLISKIYEPVAGEVNVPQGYAYMEGPDKGTFAYFILGPCEANYVPITRTLKVHVVIDEYMMRLPIGDVKGKLESFLEGPISKDGKTWNANWYNFGWLEEADAPDPNFIYANPVHLEFKKLDFPEVKKTQ